MKGTWHLVRYILEHASDFAWKRGSNKISVQLATGVGVNVFDSRYSHRDASSIHNHAVDFGSYIVAGIMRHRRYVEVGGPGYDAVQYVCRGFDLDSNPDPAAPTEAWLKACPLEEYGAGASYRIEAAEFHRARPADGTVTITTREFRTRRGGVRVFWHPDECRLAEGAPAELKVALDALEPMVLEDIVRNSLSTWF